MTRKTEYILKNLERYIAYTEQEKVKRNSYPNDIGYVRTFNFYLGKAQALASMARFFDVEIPKELNDRGHQLNQ